MTGVENVVARMVTLSALAYITDYLMYLGQ